MSKKRIVIVEDEQDIAELVSMRMLKEGYAVAVSHDGLDGLSRIRSEPPDLIILDIMLPKMSGTDVAKELRGDPRTASIPILMLTAKSEESDVVYGLRMGADDYVTKPFSLSVLTARVDALLRRAQPAAPEKSMLRAGVVSIDMERHSVEVDGESVPLTLTEFRLLSALAAAKGRVLSRNQLMDQGMGVDAIVTDRTIDVHLTALRRKLGKARTYIKTVRGVGYRLAIDDGETA
jgi:DNA-binding response OmpR family regulator